MSVFYDFLRCLIAVSGRSSDASRSKDEVFRYWFKFKKFPKPTPLNLGVGVTALNREDAAAVLSEFVFSGNVPEIEECIEGVDLSALDQKHVVPNIGRVERRGVWFPQGYDHPKG